MPRSAWPMLWTPRASSQTDPGSSVMSAAARSSLEGLVVLGGALSSLEQLAQRGQLPLDGGESLIEGAHLAAQMGHGLDRRRAESLGLAVDVAEPISEGDLVDAAEGTPQRREHADQRALEHEDGALVRRSCVHVGEKGLRSGGRRSRQKDTVFLCKGPPADPAVVGAEEARRVVPGEELAALPAALGEAPSQLIVGP